MPPPRALQRDAAAGRLDAVFDPDQAGAGAEDRASAPVVADPEAQDAVERAQYRAGPALTGRRGSSSRR